MRRNKSVLLKASYKENKILLHTKQVALQRRFGVAGKVSPMLRFYCAWNAATLWSTFIFLKLFFMFRYNEMRFVAKRILVLLSCVA